MDDKKGAIDHIKNHQEYPATKKELVASCNNLSDFSKEDKEWYKSHLSDKTYNSAEELLEALHLNK